MRGISTAVGRPHCGKVSRWPTFCCLHIGAKVVPGAFTSGTNHFAHAGSPEDRARLKEYESGPTANLAKGIMKGFELTAVADAEVSEVAKAIVNLVNMPFGTRPFRVHIDPAQDGAEIVNGVADRVRAELLRNMKLADFSGSRQPMVPAQKAFSERDASHGRPRSEIHLASVRNSMWKRGERRLASQQRI